MYFPRFVKPSGDVIFIADGRKPPQKTHCFFRRYWIARLLRFFNNNRKLIVGCRHNVQTDSTTPLSHAPGEERRNGQREPGNNHAR